MVTYSPPIRHCNFHLKEMYCRDPSTRVGHTGNYFLLHMHVSLLLSLDITIHKKYHLSFRRKEKL